MIKIMELLLKSEKWVIKRIDKDSPDYEKCLKTIEKREVELAQRKGVNPPAEQ